MRLASCRATREEKIRPMACDLLVPDPILSVTHAIDLAVPPGRAWPWLAQMGAGRAGWYSWDLLDNGGRRSADRLVPEFQHVDVGDVLPAVPGERDVFVVAHAEPPHDLVLHWAAPDGRSRVSWEFRIEPAPGGSRLVVRSRMNALALEAARQDTADAGSAALGARIETTLLRFPFPLVRPFARIGHRIMQVRQLRGLKRRIERQPAHGWFLRFGATADELTRAMPGDELVDAPQYESSRAITVRARPAEIWPWLMQMGRGRGGLYSVDWLDRLFGILDRPSARRVLPEFRDLRPGDAIPVGRRRWPVHAVERERSLVLRISEGDVLVSNAWALFPLDAETTRLVLRVRATMPMSARYRLIRALLGPQELIMARAQLRGIRRRAESLAQARRAANSREAGDSRR
jgi:uncharacterized protein YndB with AHSA1/START domain